MKSKHLVCLKLERLAKCEKKTGESWKMFGSLKVRKHQQAGRQRQKPNVLFITFVKCTNSWNPQRLKHPEIPIYPASTPRPLPQPHLGLYTTKRAPNKFTHFVDQRKKRVYSER